MNKGFTLLEILIAVVILTIAILSAITLFSRSLSISGNCQGMTIAMYELEQKAEEVCANDYQTIRSLYTNEGALQETPFTDLGSLTGAGSIYANEVAGLSDSLIRIKIVACYQEKNRIIGEDSNLNGKLDAAEDTNGNGELDSPCCIETAVANRDF
jgi:prepilin-type N-terminal cleavage/methylation domain-containing protein